MSEVHWGILGNATIARKCVMPAIINSSGGRIRALGTRSPEKVDPEFKNGIIEKIYGNYEEVLADPEVTAVYIPLPNHLHLPWTIKALEAGKHVLCEKPLACNAQEAREMAKAAESKGRLLMEALMYRFHPRSEKVREMVVQGSIGRPWLVRSAFCFSMAAEIMKKGSNYRLVPEQGGGALLDVGSYGVSVARWLLGEEPIAVQAQATFHDRHKVDIHLLASLHFGSGALASVEASFCSGLQQTYSVVGSNGALELPHDAFIPWENDAQLQWRQGDEESGETLTIAGVDEYRLMIDNFNLAVMGEKSPGITLEDSIANLEVLDALAEAIRNKSGVVSVNI